MTPKYTLTRYNMPEKGPRYLVTDTAAPGIARFGLDTLENCICWLKDKHVRNYRLDNADGTIPARVTIDCNEEKTLTDHLKWYTVFHESVKTASMNGKVRRRLLNCTSSREIDGCTITDTRELNLLPGAVLEYSFYSTWGGSPITHILEAPYKNIRSIPEKQGGRSWFSTAVSFLRDHEESIKKALENN